MTQSLFFKQPILYVSIFVAMAMAITELPTWTLLFATVLVCWRFLNEQFQLPKISPIYSTLLGVGLFILTYVQYRTIWGQVESAAILVGLIAILILNYSNFRDHRTLILLGFILSAMKPMFALDLIWAVPAFICIVGLWISLLPQQITQKFSFFSKIAFISLPLLAVLFALFPRIVIFQSNRYSRSLNVSGFSDDLNPGRVSSLVQSNKSSFFVEFDREVMISDSMISNKDLYWRGSTLTEANGFEWRRPRGVALDGPTSENPTDQKINERSTKDSTFIPKFNYTVIMEPNQHRFVFIFDVPSRIKSSSIHVDQQELSTLRTLIPTTQQQQFQFAADPNYIKRNDPVSRSRYLQIKKLPPKTAEWIEQTKLKYTSLEERLLALEEFFRKDFRYTLNPGVYDKNDLDEFLFVRKRGFCEHFAAGYATLARGLEIPARVVIGYQGGEYNPIGNFWKVVERDAHAWVEIGDKNSWKRVDPTNWIAPLRINIPSSQFFELSETEQTQQTMPKNSPQNQFENLWNQTILFFDNLNYKWTLFLLEFDQEKQASILANLFSLEAITSWLWIVLSIFIFVFIFIFLKKFRLTTSKREILRSRLQKMIEDLKKANVQVKPSMTIDQIVYEYQRQFPETKMAIFKNEVEIEYYQKSKSDVLGFFDRFTYQKKLSL